MASVVQQTVKAIACYNTCQAELQKSGFKAESFQQMLFKTARADRILSFIEESNSNWKRIREFDPASAPAWVKEFFHKLDKYKTEIPASLHNECSLDDLETYSVDLEPEAYDKFDRFLSQFENVMRRYRTQCIHYENVAGVAIITASFIVAIVGLHHHKNAKTLIHKVQVELASLSEQIDQLVRLQLTPSQTELEKKDIEIQLLVILNSLQLFQNKNLIQAEENKVTWSMAGNIATGVLGFFFAPFSSAALLIRLVCMLTVTTNIYVSLQLYFDKDELQNLERDVTDLKTLIGARFPQLAAAFKKIEEMQ